MTPVKTTIKKLLASKKVRFGLVGLLNTAIDFSLLFLLVDAAHFQPLLANVVSTSVALVCSYALNKRAVFANSDARNVRQIVLFVTVTLAGLWLVQGMVLVVVAAFLGPVQVLDVSAKLLIAKCIATLFSLTWNYLWYNRVVFSQPKHQ